jgi:hypothetical protein
MLAYFESKDCENLVNGSSIMPSGSDINCLDPFAVDKNWYQHLDLDVKLNWLSFHGICGLVRFLLFC